MSTLFSYKMTHDNGFASHALVQSSQDMGINIPFEGLIYLMKISEVLPLENYFNDARFQFKKPHPHLDHANDSDQDYGDNIYSRKAKNQRVWHPNKKHDEETHKLSDTSGKNVLISEEFYYLGQKCVAPKEG